MRKGLFLASATIASIAVYGSYLLTKHLVIPFIVEKASDEVLLSLFHARTLSVIRNVQVVNRYAEIEPFVTDPEKRTN